MNLPGTTEAWLASGIISSRKLIKALQELIERIYKTTAPEQVERLKKLQAG